MAGEMDWPGRRYRYVGPADVLAEIHCGPTGCPVRTLQEFDDWVAGRGAGGLAEPFTFVVAVDGVLHLAPRRSEHVACAGGE